MSPTHLERQQPLPRSWAEGPVGSEVEEIVGGLQNPWSISPETARVLTRVTLGQECDSILEFGAGMSSMVLAAALKQRGGGRLTSVEEQPDWCVDAWRTVETTDGVDAAMIPATVRLKFDRRGLYYGWREATAIARRGPYDIVFVDAPWGGYGRDGSLYAAIESVQDGGIIVLDDAAREREQRTVRRWLLNYPNLRLLANDCGVERGLAVLQKTPRALRDPSVIQRLLEVWGTSISDGVSNIWSIIKYLRRRRGTIPPAC
ncbi:MAG: class I SAM-dependent methyltransferase [Gemmatimonadota bacterium]|jgi:predicted O-methyltransferase YrrM